MQQLADIAHNPISIYNSGKVQTILHIYLYYHIGEEAGEVVQVHIFHLLSGVSRHTTHTVAQLLGSQFSATEGRRVLAPSA